ncbi:class I SAM-dependent methyltransferase [Modestobacter italicus]|uniref:class I SAM-dependent methyltransferase n=1 Tax=Modestobacter italicus (strain DSM 44449 / CECT 9708 / BC 501) TaxID=2732864 RepID=UPI001C947091|nr:class I SAM-dependent methyltransferase [Modestobacter italicus]
MSEQAPMTPGHGHGHDFDRAYWERHWRQDRTSDRGSMSGNPPNPHLAREIGHLVPGTALDAGCGAGAEAIWLAEHGWQVTAADISTEALARAADRAAASGVGDSVQWVAADLCDWAPAAPFDLVTTAYAHPAVPQLAFYERIARWVAPGGTLLVVGHLHGHSHGDAEDVDGQPPAEATATAASVTALLEDTEWDDAGWDVVTAAELHRTITAPDGRLVELHDVVVRATRRR